MFIRSIGPLVLHLLVKTLLLGLSNIFVCAFFQLGHAVDFSDLVPTFHRTASEPFPQMIDAVKCVKAEGLKTALLTNNWFNAGNHQTFIPIDLSLFDVVGLRLVKALFDVVNH